MKRSGYRFPRLKAVLRKHFDLVDDPNGNVLDDIRAALQRDLKPKPLSEMEGPEGSDFEPVSGSFETGDLEGLVPGALP